MRGITSNYPFSPREIKRTLNFVRFVLLLCIRWPDAALWLQWGSTVLAGQPTEAQLDGIAARRLQRLESACTLSGMDFQQRSEAAALALGRPSAKWPGWRIRTCWASSPARPQCRPGSACPMARTSDSIKPPAPQSIRAGLPSFAGSCHVNKILECRRTVHPTRVRQGTCLSGRVGGHGDTVIALCRGDLYRICLRKDKQTISVRRQRVYAVLGERGRAA